jgi:ankyrin repeat protein
MDKQLIYAAKNGRAVEVRKILEENKSINVNSSDTWGNTALHWACTHGHDKIVTMLLASPDIDVNQKDIDGGTPFLRTCLHGNTSCARLLFKDARVRNFNEPTNKGRTPLWWAALYGHLEVIKCWIASGKEMNLGEPGNEFNDAIGIAGDNEKTEVVSLLERLLNYPETTRNEVKVEPAAE